MPVPTSVARLGSFVVTLYLRAFYLTSLKIPHRA